jgi:hypothetical protein
VTARLLAYSRSGSIGSLDSAKLNRLASMLGQLGFNPADRSKVKVGGKANRARPGNAFADL